MTLTQAQLRALLPDRAMVFFYDTSYACPTQAWLTEKFYPWFKAQRWGGNWDKWQRKNDCDNFARAYCVFAQDAHASTPGNDAEALAVGEFCYFSPGGAHAIICAVTDKGTIYIEPQNGQILNLTPQEIQTCFHASF
jgi:hypothetical protein